MWIETTKESCELRGRYKSGVGTDYSYPLYGSYEKDGHTMGGWCHTKKPTAHAHGQDKHSRMLMGECVSKQLGF